ncbi:MAG: hypothetical protein AB8B96_15020 [Lysobacterales bacterium]
MHTLNELQMIEVAGGTTPNDPIFDAPISSIYNNFRNAGASISSALYQTGRVLQVPVALAGAGGYAAGTLIYNALPQEAQNTIGGTISAALDNIHSFFGNHIH